MGHLVDVLNYCAIFVSAISGSAAAIKSRADVFGIPVLAFATACSGGILRDLFIGDLPPENIRSSIPVLVTLAASMVTSLCIKQLKWFLTNPIQVFDAFGLGLFTAIGVNKALYYNITPVWAVLLGVITGVGGGMVRDILLGRVPSILHREIYATCSLAGGVFMVAGWYLKLMPHSFLMVSGAAICITMRCLALRYNWNVSVTPTGDENRRSGRFQDGDQRR